MGLTQIVAMDGSRRPLMLEVPVAVDLDGPYLVSSTKDLVWIAKAFPNGTVRTAVRVTLLPDLYRALLERITTLSQEREWGSVQPATEDGAKAVLLHLADYELLDVEVLHGVDFDTSILPLDIQTTAATWIPDGWAAVVPVDRTFVGTVFDFGEGNYAALIHNASRGVGVLVS